MATTQISSNKTFRPEPPPPQPHTWVYGKKNPGWYMARWMWVASYSEHLQSLGYSVVSSVDKPEGKPAKK
jgi:hypothetical protein